MFIEFVRWEFLHHYVLSEQDGRVKLDIYFEYFVENITGSSKPYPVVMWQHAEDNPTFHEIRLFDVNDRTNLLYLTGKQLIPRTEGIRVRVASPTIDLAPRSKGKSYRVSGRYSINPVHSVEDHVYGEPTIGVTIKAEWPPGYRIELSGKELKSQGERPESPEKPTSAEWGSSELLMPGAVIGITWTKPDSKPSPAQVL